jgi:pilus assembly protein CpaB
MTTKQRVPLALTSALVLAGVCTILLQRTLLHAAAAKPMQRFYLTPAHAMHPGDMMRAEDLKSLPWPADDAVSGAISRREDATNRVALSNIATGQPILESDLAVAGSGTGLASRIPNGMRAIALKSDEVIGVAGFLNPGSHVDVLFSSHYGFGNDAVTSTVLQNVEVVATNQQIEPNPNGKPTTATVVTLLLTPPEAQRALLASNQGSLQLVLRNSADKSVSDEAPVALSQIAPLSQGSRAQAMMSGASPLPATASPLPTQRVAAIGASRTPKSTTHSGGGIEMVYGGRSNQPAMPSDNPMGGKL